MSGEGCGEAVDDVRGTPGAIQGIPRFPAIERRIEQHDIEATIANRSEKIPFEDLHTILHLVQENVDAGATHRHRIDVNGRDLPGPLAGDNGSQTRSRAQIENRTAGGNPPGIQILHQESARRKQRRVQDLRQNQDSSAFNLLPGIVVITVALEKMETQAEQAAPERAQRPGDTPGRSRVSPD